MNYRDMSQARMLWKLIWILNWLLIYWFWWQGSWEALFLGGASSAVALGRLAGLAATYMILLQFFFMGRTPWLERVFGLDSLSRIHHTNGLWGFVFIVLHPLLLVWGYKSLAGFSMGEQFVSFLTDFEGVAFAFLGMLLFLVVIGSSIVIVRKRFRYESWYFVHLVTYAAVFLSLPHQISIGTTLTTSTVFYSYWLALYILVFANHLVFRFGRPVYNHLRHSFHISRIVRENHNTVSVYMSGKHLDEFPIQAGQFMILRFLTPGRWWQAHPFSLSRMPDGKELRVTIKELGDFTQGVAHLLPGTTVIIDGPYGVFTKASSASEKVLFIAGGIGVTPIRSLVEDMVRMGKDAVMLYGNKTENDIVFREELENLEKHYGTKITHVLSDSPGYQGEKGYIDEEKIKRLIPDVASREVFLCGPPSMMNATIAILRGLGIPESKIHYEKFSFA